ncbi:hypothetical protein M422DRAFT_166548, partial [Sphaerobolus stellatus SS14]
RATARTTNFTVIIVGAGLSALLAYALATELFARNSPTVLYNDACEKIKASPAVHAHLRPPFIFHNHPPLTHRPRHRNRSVNSLLTVDSSGREHLLLNFFIEGSDPSTSSLPVNTDEPLMDRLSSWAQDKTHALSGLTADDALNWSKAKVHEGWRRTKTAFAYLTGAPVPPAPQPTTQTIEVVRDSGREKEGWSLTGAFGRMIGRRSSGRESRTDLARVGIWTTGEVHADLIKDEDGKFVYRYLLINLPDSNSRNAQRIFVERMDGVPEHESILRWSSH